MSDQKKLIAVCGATGSQGGSVLKYLIESGRYRVRALTRDTLSAKASALKKYGSDVELWQCDTRNADESIKALSGCWGAFLLTDFWSDPEKMIDEEAKFGRILIDAAVEAKLTFCIWSSLSNVEILSEGKLQVPHFTNKNLVEEYARNEFRESKVATKFGFIYPGFYLQNLLGTLPGVGFKFDSNGKLINEPLPLFASTKIPVINIEELGKWTLPMFDRWEQFENNVVFGSNDYITIPDLMSIVAKRFNIDYEYKSCTYDEYYNIVQNLEMVHMFQFMNEYGYYGGAQLGDFRKWAPNVLSVEDAIKSLNWESALKPGIAEKITSKIGETITTVKDTVVGAFSRDDTKSSSQAVE